VTTYLNSALERRTSLGCNNEGLVILIECQIILNSVISCRKCVRIEFWAVLYVPLNYDYEYPKCVRIEFWVIDYKNSEWIVKEISCERMYSEGILANLLFLFYCNDRNHNWMSSYQMQELMNNCEEISCEKMCSSDRTLANLLFSFYCITISPIKKCTIKEPCATVSRV
jgi:hypothetical protein